MIRAGEERDLAQLLAMSALMRDETITMRAILIDEAKLASVYRRAFDPNDDRMCLFVYERSGQIQGGMLGYIAEYYFSRELFAADLYLYVTPECRRSLASGLVARRLFQGYRDWAIARGVREVRAGVSTGIMVQAAHRFYMGLGMTHIGGHYTLPVVAKDAPA